jgi:hypothetical protein
MAKKMTLSGYLAQRGTKAKALTRGEAALLGIPYPLQAGWPRRYGAVEIDDDLLLRLAACAELARQAAEERAIRAREKSTGSSAALQQLTLMPSAPVTMKVVAGFVLRRARRYCTRKPAPWT